MCNDIVKIVILKLVKCIIFQMNHINTVSDRYQVTIF